MKVRHGIEFFVVVTVMSLLLPKAVLAASGSVEILSPKNGQTVDGHDGVELKYNVTLSPTGNHLHVYVDRRRPIIDHNVSGCPCTLKLPMLSPGKHRVAVKEATVHHHLTGVGKTVTFNVK